MKQHKSLLLFLGQVLLPVLLALAALGSAQAIAAGWSNPTTLGTSSLYVMYENTGSVAVASTGTSVAVWRDPAAETLRYATRKNGVWSTPLILARAINTSTTMEMLSNPRVVIDNQDTITVVWASSKRTQQYCVIGTRVTRCYVWTGLAKAATLPVGAASWTMANLSAPGLSVTNADIGLDQNGDAVVLWTYVEKKGSPTALQSATRLAAGAWSPPETLYSSINPISLSDLSVGANGAVVAVWQEQIAGTANPSVRAVYKPVAGSTWGSMEEVAQPTGCSTLRAAIDGNGQAAVAWNNNYAVEWARRSDGMWLSEQLLSAPGRVYSSSGPYSVYGEPDLAADSQGRFLISWLENDANGELAVEAQLHQPDGIVANASWAAGSVQNWGGGSPVATISPDGSGAMVGWISDSEGSAYSASLVPGQGWGQPLVLGSAPAWGMGIALAGGPSGTASALWIRGGYANYGVRILGSTYQP